VMSVTYFTLWMYASHAGRLLHSDADPRVVSGITRSYLPGTPVYLTATLVAFVSPLASVIMFAAIALFYVIESSVFGRAATG